MRRDGNIVSYTADELDEMLERGESLTDWAKVDAKTEEELEASIDEDEEGVPLWDMALPVSFNLPGKKQLTIRLDADLLDWFKAQGGGYQTRINAVLRSYVEAQKASNGHKSTREKKAS